MSERIGSRKIEAFASCPEYIPIIFYDQLLSHTAAKAMTIDPEFDPKRATHKLFDMLVIADSTMEADTPDSLDNDVAVIVAGGILSVVQPERVGAEEVTVDPLTADRARIYMQAALVVVHPLIFSTSIENPIVSYINRF